LDLTDTAPPCYDMDYVGLAPGRPITACTNIQDTSHLRLTRRSGDSAPGSIANMRYIEIRTPGELGNVPLHSHAFYEIVLFRQGGLYHLLRDGEHLVEEGDVLLLPPRLVHGYRNRDIGCYTDMYLLPDWLQEELRVLWNADGLVQFLLAHALYGNPANGAHCLHLRCTPGEKAAWEQELRVIDQEYKGASPCMVTINGCFLKVLGVLNRAFARHVPDIALPIRREVWQVTAEIERCILLGLAPTPETLARGVAMSPRHLTRVFREATGSTPFAYYQQRRMAHARRRLAESQPSITTVAYQLGFSDTAHFSRLFRQSEGMSPRAFRQRHLGRR